MAHPNNPTALPASLVSALIVTLRDIAHQMSRMTEAADHSNRLTDHATRAFEWLATNIAENTAAVRSLHDHFNAPSRHPEFPAQLSPQVLPQPSLDSSIITVEQFTLHPPPPPVQKSATREAITPPPSSSVSNSQTSVPAMSLPPPPPVSPHLLQSTTLAPPSPHQKTVIPPSQVTLPPPNLVAQSLKVSLHRHAVPPTSRSSNNNVLPHRPSTITTASAVASQALATGGLLPDDLPSNRLRNHDQPLQKQHTHIPPPPRMTTRLSPLNKDHARRHSSSSHSTRTHCSKHSCSSTLPVDLTTDQPPAKRPAPLQDPRMIRLSWSSRHFSLPELDGELRAEKSRISKRSWAKGDSNRYNAEILRVHREVMTIKDPVNGPHATLPRRHTPPRRRSRAVGAVPGTRSKPQKPHCLPRSHSKPAPIINSPSSSSTSSFSA